MFQDMDKDAKDIPRRKLKEKDEGRQHDPEQSNRVDWNKVLRWTMGKYAKLRLRQQVIEEGYL